MLTTGETTYDFTLPSEEEQLKWALNESSKALVNNNKVQDDSDDDDDPELARVLEESKALFDKFNNGRDRDTSSPDVSPSLLGGGAAGCNSNNNTGDSGYCGSSIDLTVDDELQQKVGGAEY